jgi:hypothetical protein
MNDTYLQLLAFLEPWGIDREVQIEAQLYDWFTHQISVDPLEPFDSINARIERFLDVISENKHIFFAKQKIRVEGKEDRWQVQVRLTFLGLQYLNQHRLTLSNIELNNSTIASNGIISANSTTQTTILQGQRIYLYITALLTLANVLITVINLSSNDLKDKLQTQLQEQTKQIHKLQIELSEATNLHFQELKATKTSPKNH